MNTLDPSGALVLDLRALGLQQRAGSMITVDRTVPAPGSLGVALATVPVGSPVEIELRLESVMEGVLVSGTADIHVDAECALALRGYFVIAAHTPQASEGRTLGQAIG